MQDQEPAWRGTRRREPRITTIERHGQKFYLTDEQVRRLMTGQVMTRQEDADDLISFPPHRWYHYVLFVALGILTIFALCAMGRPGA